MAVGANSAADERNPAAVDYSYETEAATRDRIDAQLRQAGWDVNSKEIAFANGARPQRGLNRAIAGRPQAVLLGDFQEVVVAGASEHLAAGIITKVEKNEPMHPVLS